MAEPVLRVHYRPKCEQWLAKVVASASNNYLAMVPKDIRDMLLPFWIEAEVQRRLAKDEVLQRCAKRLKSAMGREINAMVEDEYRHDLIRDQHNRCSKRRGTFHYRLSELAVCIAYQECDVPSQSNTVNICSKCKLLNRL
jgi:hypothetical protein